MATDLATTLLIAPDAQVLLLNAPIGYAKKLAPLPAGASITNRRGTPADVAIVFVRDSAELRRFAPSFGALEEDAVLWVCYPTGGATAGTDLDPDALHEALAKHELAGVMLVALDETWSAMRFRAPEDAGS
ncbi:MAG TPA: hypothetical protein VGT60_10400 [Candidatus Limnocylindria bacterium]|nr:hypothetical protein [Candidatus Limnocylindria bacterium]